MIDRLIKELSKIEEEEKIIKKGLDRYYRDETLRTRCYYRLRDLKQLEKKLKFKIRMEQELNNEKSR